MRGTTLTIFGVSLVLAGCSADQEELQQWMAQQQKEIKPHVAQIAASSKFVPQPYLSLKDTDPFSNRKMDAGAAIARQPNAVLASEMRRRKEPLEDFPLDSMSLVGSVVRNGKQHALIKVDNLLHYVKVGEYMGQNYGKITNLTEKELTLREIVQDASGEWTERTSTLQLQEKAQ